MTDFNETNPIENMFTPDELILKQPEIMYYQQQQGTAPVNSDETIKSKSLSKTSAIIILLIITTLYTVTMMLSAAVAKKSGFEPNNKNSNYSDYFYTQEA